MWYVPLASRSGGDGSDSQPPSLDCATGTPPLAAASVGATHPGGTTGFASGSTRPPGGGPDGRSPEARPSKTKNSSGGRTAIIAAKSRKEAASKGLEKPG